MPRRRATRAAQSRPKPRVPDGDEGADLEKDLKTEKLKVIMADFNSEMAAFFKSMKEDIRDYEKNIECVYTMSLAKIPKYIREMNIEDYLNAGGTLASDPVAEQIEMSLDDDMPLMKLTKSKKKTKKKGKKSATGEEPTTMKRPPPRRKKTVNSNTENMPPRAPVPSTSRPMGRSTRQRGQFETPYHMGGPSALGWETPLITPKFDPRLPITPTMTRRPKDGEVFFSLAGSPIANNDDRQTMTLKRETRTNKTRLIIENTELDLDNVQIPDVQQATVDYLRTLRQKLNAIPLSPKSS